MQRNLYGLVEVLYLELASNDLFKFFIIFLYLLIKFVWLPISWKILRKKIMHRGILIIRE